MEALSMRQIAKVVGVSMEGIGEEVIELITTKPGKAVRGSLFIELAPGTAELAAQQGTSVILSSRQPVCDCPVLRVEAPEAALAAIASYYRSLFRTFLAAVTGSVGKTTTTDMIYAVLSQNGKTLHTERNLNDLVGLPLTILGLDSSYKNAVIEMAMAHQGDIARLSQVARPSVGVITNIGYAHMAHFSVLEDILTEKLSITEGMNPTAPLILNGDDPHLENACENLRQDVILYGIDNPAADITATNLVELENGMEFEVSYFGKHIKLMIPVWGRHLVSNALAAFSVGVVANMQADAIAAGLRGYKASPLRQNIVKLESTTLILDCYNAGPESMKMALSLLKRTPGKRRVAVLGDMPELGEMSEEAHRKVGRFAAECGVDLLLCIGRESQYILEEAKNNGKLRAIHFADKETLATYLHNDRKPGDVVLYKAGRPIQLEEVARKVYHDEVCTRK